MVVDLALNSPGAEQWTLYEVALAPEAFQVSDATFDAILADVTELRIDMEGLVGRGSHGLDDFTPLCP